MIHVDARKALRRTLFASSALAVLFLFETFPASASSCEDLKRARIPNTTITTAESIPAGNYTTANKTLRQDMPAFCRVVASVKNASDSDVGVEMWLPQADWKGVFHANGSGGYGGNFATGYDGMEAGIKRGYASATTDMGTAPSSPLDGDPLIGHPQKWKDWGLLSTHVMAVVGKAITATFYGLEPKRAYYTGCSTGGQEGLIEAQHFPADFDGIISGAPVINRTHLHTAFLWDYRAANLQPSHKLSADKLMFLHKSAIAACSVEGKGGKSDPFVADPVNCKFDPASLTCKASDSASCLTPGEVETAKAFYGGPTNPRTNEAIYFGWPVGSEIGWLNWSFLETPVTATEPAFDSLFKWVKGKNWNWRDFDYDKDLAEVDATLGADVNSGTVNDLRQFKERGGKLIIFHGLADSIVDPFESIAFYKAATIKLGGVQATQSFARLFLAPGISHCGRGEGPNAFNSAVDGGPRTPSNDADHDMFTAIAKWVEEGSAPDRIVATKFVDNEAVKGIAMQRPLCPYPQSARYNGVGSTNDAGNFVCVAAGN